MKVGIIQGRLSMPSKGKIQEFPTETWKDEFETIKELGLDGIEWILTSDQFLNNPLLTELDLPKEILSICVDNIVNAKISDSHFVYENLVPVLNKMIDINVKKIVVPLLEDSNVNDEKLRKKFIENISQIADQYPEVEFCFEFETKIEIIMEILESRDNFYLTYDTGNFTSFYGKSVDHKFLINLFGKKIKNVHIKDRDYNGNTKPFGFGNTDFDIIFETLKEIGYIENFILQLSRGENGRETDYIKNIYKIIKNQLNEKYF
jgi:sugar phosphate isomerase/epimerase